MKIAETFEDKTHHELPGSIISNEYLSKFADKMMLLSNRLNEVGDEDEYRDDFDIKEEYLPAIQEYILNITGL